MTLRIARPSRTSFSLYVACVAALATQPAPHASAQAEPRWTSTWTASPHAMFAAQEGLDPGVPSSLNDQTVRQILHVSGGARTLRVVLTNAYGKAPLVIGDAHVARTDAGPTIVAGSDRALTFSGEKRVVLPPGAPAISDPVELELPALSDLTVSVYIPQPTPLETFHWTGQETGYLAAGNVTAATSVTASATFLPRLFVSAVLGAATGTTRAVAAFGDSITDGSSASVDSNQRWPDRLAARLAPHRLSAINAGISGNKLLEDGMGANAVARFERDVLSQPGVESAIVLIGVNDLGAPLSGKAPSHTDFIAGYRQLIAQAHSRGVRIFGATLTPFEGALEDFAPGYYTPEKEQVRSQINAWIRTSGEFDGVVDFDRALRDPERLTRMAAAYDSGDHLHPNDAGNRALAEAVDLGMLVRRR